MFEDNHESIKDVLQKLPPNYDVGTLYVKGAIVPVARFVNYSGELAYFIGADYELIVIDGDKIDGMSFGSSDPCDDEDMEESSD